MKRFLVACTIVVLTFVIVFLALSIRKLPPPQPYGVSFSKLHSEELGLDWQETYRAILEDLGVRKLRLSATWPMIQPNEVVFDFEALDIQMQEAEKYQATVILAVGKKTPGWPECHIPEWVAPLSVEAEHTARLRYIEEVVNRYKNSPVLAMWQIENEPFLDFARDLCGEPHEAFLHEEISLVKKLDPAHPILITDGGEFGLWAKARAVGDVFGSTMYLYVYTNYIGYWRYPILPGFFRAKQNILDLLTGKKQSISIEVGLEPWLKVPIVQTPIEEQLRRMNVKRFDEIISFATRTGFSEHYLWGAEWWYYMKINGHPEFWNRAQALFEK